MKNTNKEYKYLGILTILYVVFQLVSDITAGKIIALGTLTVSATALYFPITYIIADLLTEVYGYREARKVVWIVLSTSILAGTLYTIVAVLPPAPGFDANAAYVRVLGQVPRILVGGWIAVWCGAILNDYILAKMKIWTKGKYLWTRTIGSTIVGEGANTALFYVIALGGILPRSLFISSILAGWSVKVLVEVVCTPITYAAIKKMKEIEGIDVFDKNTNFNPFKF